LDFLVGLATALYEEDQQVQELQTAAVVAGGYIDPSLRSSRSTELYDGSTWTNNPTGLNTARF
jgi:hypothetical protein